VEQIYSLLQGVERFGGRNLVQACPYETEKLAKSGSEQDTDFMFVEELRAGKISLLPHFAANVVLCSSQQPDKNALLACFSPLPFNTCLSHSKEKERLIHPTYA